MQLRRFSHARVKIVDKHDRIELRKVTISCTKERARLSDLGDSGRSFTRGPGGLSD